jgi:acyl carrier protein
MTRSEVQVRLTGVFRDVFQSPELELWDAMAARDVPGWDSMNNVRLILSVEAEFACKFTLREIGKQQNVGELMDLIIKKTT